MKHIYHSFQNINIQIEYWIGTNARENTHIIGLSNREDIWFHAQDHPSCHVIARIPRGLTKKQKMTIVKMGCMLCKQHTNKLKNETKLQINYTQIKNITKSETEGTVLTCNLKTYAV
jgi:predicted ribosome quality control (RQC) complex YloA/Tae2 family protein